MSGRFDGKVAVVVGGASGIGHAISTRLAREGASVMVADINSDALAELSIPGTVESRRTDATDEGDVEALISEAVTTFGSMDVMINAAGGPRAALLTELSAEDWDAVMRLNLYSAFYGTRLAARHFIRAGAGGVVVNIASLSSQVPMHLGVGYNAAKAGVVMLSRQAALELAGDNIRVNAVSPGLVATPMAAGLLDTPDVADKFMDLIPAGRAGTPAEVAAAVAFLASDDASYVSGQNLFVDGAWTTAGYPDLRGLR